MQRITHLLFIGFIFLCFLSCAKKEDLVSPTPNYIDVDEPSITFNFEDFIKTDANSLLTSPGYLAHYSHSDSRSIYVTTNELNLTQPIEPGSTEFSLISVCGVQASLRDNGRLMYYLQWIQLFVLWFLKID